MKNVYIAVWTDLDHTWKDCSIQTKTIIDNMLVDIQWDPEHEVSIIITWWYIHPQSHLSEADVMLAYITQQTHTMKKEKEIKIRIENMSTNTDTNMYYSLLLVNNEASNIYVYSWHIHEKTLHIDQDIQSHWTRVALYGNYRHSFFWRKNKITYIPCTTDIEFCDAHLNSQFRLKDMSLWKDRESFWFSLATLLCTWRNIYHTLDNVTYPLRAYLDNIYWTESTSFQAFTLARESIQHMSQHQEKISSLHENIEQLEAIYIKKKKRLEEKWFWRTKKDS